MGDSAKGYDFEICKVCAARAARPRYALSGRSCPAARLFVCGACGLHYIDYLDPAETLAPDFEHETPKSGEYVQQYSYRHRHQAHVALLASHAPLAGKRVLDVGCGRGMFLSLLKEAGAFVCGLELYDQAVSHARSAGLEVHKVPVEHAFWQANHAQGFDIITLWDVIEHVNFPAETLEACARLLAPGGLLVVGTPCRDSFYHRAGAVSYRLSRGRFPTFLNIMYSNHLYGHKQILSTADMRSLYRRAGLAMLELSKTHELSIPYRHYLRKLFRSELLAYAAYPPVWILLRLLRIKNKMIAVGRKP